MLSTQEKEGVRIGVYVGDLGSHPNAGGGHTLLQLTIRQLKQMANAKKTVDNRNIEFYFFYTGSLELDSADKQVFIRLRWSGLRQKIRSALARISDMFLLPYSFACEMEQRALALRLDLVWLTYPVFARFEKIPYVCSVWDLGHRQYPAFPEMRWNRTWEHREALHQYMMPRASALIVGNGVGAKELCSYYNVDSERVCAVEFPTPVELVNCQPKIVERLIGRRFLFYPAQFWPHKNHYVALQVVRLLRDAGDDMEIVFTGADKGNREHCEMISKELGVEDRVHFLGFVSREELVWLYRNAFSLAYFSLLGPNNLPPLEAMLLGCPAIVSDLAGHREQFGSAVLYADPRNAMSWVQAVRMIDDGARERLLAEGFALAHERSVDRYCDQVLECLEKVLAEKRNWRTVR